MFCYLQITFSATNCYLYLLKINNIRYRYLANITIHKQDKIKTGTKRLPFLFIS